MKRFFLNTLHLIFRIIETINVAIYAVKSSWGPLEAFRQNGTRASCMLIVGDIDSLNKIKTKINQGDNASTQGEKND